MVRFHPQSFLISVSVLLDIRYPQLQDLLCCEQSSFLVQGQPAGCTWTGSRSSWTCRKPGTRQRSRSSTGALHDLKASEP